MTDAPSPTHTHDTGAHETSRGTASSTHAAKGLLIGAIGELLVFRPLDTSYEHHLEVAGGASAFVAGNADLVGRIVRAVIRVNGRKVYAVKTGGNFVQPILGTPRIIQGRALALEGNTLYVKANAVFAVELPTGKDTIDLDTGTITVGSMVNVVALPGASIELQPA